MRTVVIQCVEARNCIQQCENHMNIVVDIADHAFTNYMHTDELEETTMMINNATEVAVNGL